MKVQIISSALFLATRLSFSALTPLPEGQGLAASYSNDGGIAADPSVLFSENFEGYSGSRVSWADGIGGWDNAYGDQRSGCRVRPSAGTLCLDHPAGRCPHGAEERRDRSFSRHP